MLRAHSKCMASQVLTKWRFSGGWEVLLSSNKVGMYEALPGPFQIDIAVERER